MICLESYIDDLIENLKTTFQSRLLYVGLQGSYLRGEATEKSDIDIMVILDALSMNDLKEYRSIIQNMDYYERSCGFICGASELAKWNPLEICSLLHSTKDYYGQLSNYVPSYSEEDIVHFIKLGIGNLYHEICHRYIHRDQEKNKNALPYSYKSVFFILQNIYFLKDKMFYKTKQELLCHLSPQDQKIMQNAMHLANDSIYDFDSAFEDLLQWCQNTLSSF
jgi:predicted nucleotidyltransferase